MVAREAAICSNSRSWKGSGRTSIGLRTMCGPTAVVRVRSSNSDDSKGTKSPKSQ